MKVVFLVLEQTLDSLLQSDSCYDGIDYHFFIMSDCEEVLQVIQTFRPDMFVLEERLSAMAGTAFSRILSQQTGMADVPILVLSGTEEDTTCTAPLLGMTSPFTNVHLSDNLDTILPRLAHLLAQSHGHEVSHDAEAYRIAFRSNSRDRR